MAASQPERRVMRLRRGSGCAALVLLVGGLFVSGSAATAAEPEDGWWYIDALHVRDAWNAGFTGEGVTVAVIDSPINVGIPALAGADVRVREPSFCFDEGGGDFFPAASTALTGPTNASHGTNVAAMIVGNGQGYNGNPGPMGVAPGATVLYYTVVTEPVVETESTIECVDAPHVSEGNLIGRDLDRAIDDAIDNGADIVSVSLVVDSVSAEVIARAHREGVVIVGGVPNPGRLGMSIWPAGSNGVVAVNGVDPEAKLLASHGIDNLIRWATVAGPAEPILLQGYGGEWSESGLGGGTSYATPIVAGFLAVVLEKYPEATGNQLIQSLIHNTGGSGHELTRGPVGFGYGVVSLTSMLEVDPTQYEDVNPLLTEDGSPTLDEINEINESVSPSAAPDVDPDDAGETDDTDNADDTGDTDGAAPAVAAGLGFLVLVVVIGMSVLVLAGVVVILVVVRRSRRNHGATK